MPRSFAASDRAHARVYHYWLGLNAWRCLSPAARCILIEFLCSYRPPGPGRDGNNGKLAFGLRTLASAVGIGKDSVKLALVELEKAGWLIPRKLGRGNQRTEFCLTRYTCDVTGEPASCAFEFYEPSPLASKARRSRVGLQGQTCPASGTLVSACKDGRPLRSGPVQLSDALKSTPVFKTLDENAIAGLKRS